MEIEFYFDWNYVQVDTISSARQTKKEIEMLRLTQSSQSQNGLEAQFRKGLDDTSEHGEVRSLNAPASLLPQNPRRLWRRRRVRRYSPA